MNSIVLPSKEILRFLIVGITTVCIDYVFYRLFFYLDVGLVCAKSIGFLSGSLFAYFANRFWTFSKSVVPRSNVFRFFIVYGVNLAVNVILNKIILSLLSEWHYSFFMAFFVATGASAVLNFLGMKFFVFNILYEK
ncbi:GtrA family protein [Dickeya zeae]|uniref:GtrA family protein n=1 Tax=Dickeya zeae TaxID=204042 RepID=UPI00035C2939|nr:GtrA family protein [Dickeya zeae]UJR53170.1 GtrA family protein [Dickeya zeae MS1]